jgi:hypothetical protein
LLNSFCVALDERAIIPPYAEDLLLSKILRRLAHQLEGRTFRVFLSVHAYSRQTLAAGSHLSLLAISHIRGAWL